MLNKLSDQQQGILMIVAGVVLLLHSLGILQRGLGLLIVVAALLLLYYGIKMAGYEKYFTAIFKKGKKKVKEEVKDLKERQK
ncbi:MAG: hypothetical protein WD068_03650 [Candidatus Babeliales bacterium]